MPIPDESLLEVWSMANNTQSFIPLYDLCGECQKLGDNRDNIRIITINVTAAETCFTFSQDMTLCCDGRDIKSGLPKNSVFDYIDNTCKRDGRLASSLNNSMSCNKTIVTPSLSII